MSIRTRFHRPLFCVAVAVSVMSACGADAPVNTEASPQNVSAPFVPVDLIIDAPARDDRMVQCRPVEKSASREILGMVADVIGFDAQTNNQIANLLPTSVQHALLW